MRNVGSSLDQIDSTPVLWYYQDITEQIAFGLDGCFEASRVSDSIGPEANLIGVGQYVRFLCIIDHFVLSRMARKPSVLFHLDRLDTLSVCLSTILANLDEHVECDSQAIHLLC